MTFITIRTWFTFDYETTRDRRDLFSCLATDDDRLKAYELEHGSHPYPEFTHEALASLKGTDLYKLEQLARFLTIASPEYAVRYRQDDKKYCCLLSFIARETVVVADSKGEAYSLAATDLMRQLADPSWRIDTSWQVPRRIWKSFLENSSNLF